MKQFLLFLTLLFLLFTACNRGSDITPPAAAPFKLVYISAPGSSTGPLDIYTKEGDGTPVRIVAAPGFQHMWPRISPTKQKLLFIRYPASVTNAQIPGESELYVSNADGTGAVKIVAKGANGWSEMATPAWSNDGTKIVLAARKSAGDPSWHIFTINADGSNPVQVSTRTGAYYGEPAWSPDGSKIAFIGVPSGTAGFVLDSLEVFVMNVNGTNEVRLTRDINGNHFPAWSPDGETIAFTENLLTLPRRSYIKAIKPDGTNLRTIYTEPVNGDVRYPRYNPVGDYVFFVRQAGGTYAHIACVQRNGENLVDVTNGAVNDDEMVDVIN